VFDAMLAEGWERMSSSSVGIVSLVDALGVFWSVGMSRVQASISPYCVEVCEPGSGGRCAIIFRVVGERREAQFFSSSIRNMREQLESGMATGLVGAVSFKTGSSRILWKAKRAVNMAVSED
jgi:hypothetical protein